MNKHLPNSLRALFLSLAVLLSLPMLAVEIEIDGINYDLNADATQATVIEKRGGKYSGEVIIPESVEHEGTAYSVTSIGKCAFYNCSSLTSVTIPNSVKSIGDYAFVDCSGLTSVSIGNSVASIGEMAFLSCYSLTSVSIGNSVESIGYSAFQACSGLTSVTIGNSVTSIGDNAFYGCSRLTSVTIPNSVTSIGGGAFCDCSGLTSVTIGNSVTSIGECAFWGCSGLTSVTIPNSVTSIGYSAFQACSGLTSVTIGNSVTSIGSGAFAECSGLTSVTIGNSVESIGGYAFSGSSELLDVYCYAENVPSTESDAFEYLPLADATLHVPAASMNSYKATAPWSGFENIVAITTEVDGINYDFNAEAKQATVIAKSGGKYSGEVVIPVSVEHDGTAYSVTSIGDYAFYGCSALTSVTIPNSVESIGNYAFENCFGLTSVHISDIAAWCNIDFHGSFSNPFSYAHHLYLNGEEVKDLVIPNSVTSIGDIAFYKCSGLTSVTIPYSVTSIGDMAFYNCSGLTSVTIPNSVTSIGKYAFEDCSALTSIVVEEGNTVYDSRNNCNAIIETASNSLICGCNTSIIPNGVESIGDWAFSNCSGLTSVTIPNSVTSIGDYAFHGCSGLTSVTIPNSVTSIGESAFYYCSGLTSVTIPNSVTSIGDWAFYWCSGLTSVTIPNSVTSIGYNAFYCCFDLTSVTIPNSVKSIGEGAFSDCSDLLEVYCYAENVPSTESDAFEDSPIKNATLYVPAASVESYKTTEPWSGFGKIVAISESTSDLVIKDGESFENTEERELGTLTYTRTLPNRYWNPLYVPFKIPYEALKDNYDVAYINSMHSYDNDQNGEIDKMTMEVIKIKKGVLKANHPYLIRAKNEAAKQMDLLLEDVTLYPTVSNKLDCSSVYTHFEITGTYKKMTRGDLGESLVITTDGAWKKLATSSILKPFRFYLTITDREGSPLEVSEDAKSRINICVQGEDDFATGIDEVKLENANAKTAVYDLSGRRVQKAQKGIFIQNGKLMVK